MPQNRFFTKLEFILPILIVNSFGLVGLVVFLPRSVIYFEYAFVLLFLVYARRPIYACIAFLVIFLFDLLNIFSSAYLFSIGEFLSNLKYAELFKLSGIHAVSFVILVSYCFFVCLALFKYSKKIKAKRNQFLITMIGFYFFVVLVDVWNGSTKMVSTDKIFRFSSKNISSFLAKEYYYFIHQNLNLENQVPSHLPAKGSTAFALMGTDQSDRQMLVIMESWGLPRDSIFWGKMQQLIADRVVQRKMKPFWGKTRFKGSTTAAEMRELIGLQGSYKYFFDRKSVSSDFPSVFDKKKQDGYATYGFHAFTGKMFARGIWWKNIGLDHVFFRDDIMRKNILNAHQLDGGTPFPSIKDESMFDFMRDVTSGSKRKFVYLLTVNTHLPFKQQMHEEPSTVFAELQRMTVSIEAKSQMKRIVDELFYFIDQLNPSEWDDVLFVGDHIPPFMREGDRNFYNPDYVPYLFITH